MSIWSSGCPAFPIPAWCILSMVQQNQDIGPSLRQKLLDTSINPNSLSLLKIEMAVVADVGEHFVK